MRALAVTILTVLVGLTGPPAAPAFGPLGDDFRISFMEPDGDVNSVGLNPSVAYNPSANEYLVVWLGEGSAPLGAGEFEVFAQRVSASGALLGGRIRVSHMGPDGDASYTANPPRVAYNPTANEYLVAWSGDDDTAPLVDDEVEVFAQRVSASGALLGGRIRVSDMGPDGSEDYSASAPSVAYNPANDQYLVTWRGDDNTAPLVDGEFEIFGQQLTGATGGAVGVNDFRISDMGPNGNLGYSAFAPSVAYNSADSLYLVVWMGDDDTAPLVNNELEIFGQVLTAAGVQAGVNDFRISDMGPDGNPSYGAARPSVVYSSADNQFLVTWVGDDDTAALVDEEFEIFGQRLTNFGVEGGANDFRISDMGPDGTASYFAFEHSVAYSSADNQFLVTWAGDDDTAPLVDDEFEIFGQRLDRAGDEAGANDFRISDVGLDGNTDSGAAAPSVAYNSTDNQYLVTFDGDDGRAPLVDNELEIFGQRLGEPPPPGGGGTPVGGGTQVGGGNQVGGGIPGGPPAFGATTLVTLGLAARRIPATGPLGVRVTNGNGFELSGTVSGRTVAPVSAARRRHVRLKAKTFRVAAQGRQTVRLKLPRALRRALRRTGRLSLRLTAKVNDPAGNTRTVRKRVTPKLKRRR